MKDFENVLTSLSPIILFLLVNVQLSETQLQATSSTASLFILDAPKALTTPPPWKQYFLTLDGRGRDMSYHPQAGYEPYWAGGDWMFKPTTPPPDDVCGKPCNPMFEQYGMICGGDIHGNRKNFTNYCLLIKEDCTGDDEWTMIYRGKCMPDELPILFFSESDRWALTRRATDWLNTFFSLGLTTISARKQQMVERWLAAQQKAAEAQAKADAAKKAKVTEKPKKG